MKQKLPGLEILQNKLLKACQQIQVLLSAGRSAACGKLKSLIRRRDKYAKQLLSLTSPLSKAAAIVAVAALTTTGTQAQNCRTFANADAVNPIAVSGLPSGTQPYFVDIDGDGDLDCYILDAGNNYELPFLLKNVGTAKLPSYQYTPSESGFETGPYQLYRPVSNVQFIDIDGDGDYDCFMSDTYAIFGGGDVHILFYENQGDAQHPHFEENSAKNPVAFARGSYMIGFTFADMDGDGDLDLYYYDDWGGYVYQNAGTKTNPQYQFQKQVGGVFATTDRTYYDWNKDGLLDYFQNGRYYKNIGPKKKPGYQQDDAGAPIFGNGLPHQFTDINSDGAPEVFNSGRGFSTLAPVPVIDSSSVKLGGKIYTKLSVSPAVPGYTYRWYLNRQLLPNAKAPSVVARFKGAYTTAITDSCGTGVSRDFVVGNQPSAFTASYFAGSESMAGVSNAFAVKAYPNPFTDAFTLQLATGYSTSATIVKVIDIQGRVVISTRPSGNTLQLGSSFQKGMYLVQVWQNGVVAFTQKVMKE